MSKQEECDVCEGHGEYPIHNRLGKHLYSIQCPECFGSGEALEPQEEQEDYEYGPSTAAKIKTMEDLWEHLREQG